MEDKSIWMFSFLLWAWSTLSFMAGMSIASGIFVMSSLWFLYRHKESRAPLRNRSFLIACLCFFAAALLSVGAAIVKPPLGLPLESFSSLQKFHFFLLPFLACTAFTGTSKDQGGLNRHPIWDVLFWMGLLVSVVGILQFWGASLFPASWLNDRFFRVIATGEEPRRYHAQGLMYFHLSFASAMGFFCSWAGARVLWPLKDESARDRAAWFFLALLSFLTLFFTFSRIAWFALAGILVTLAFLKRPKWGVVSTLVIFCIALLSWNFSETMRGRWNLGMKSFFERQEVWAGAMAMVRDRPITGVGFGKTGYYSHPYEVAVLGYEPQFSSHAHNNFLDMLAAMGILGLLAFLAWWGVLGVFAWRAFRDSRAEDRWIPAGCLAGLVAFQINGFTQVNFFDAKSQHSLMLWAGVVLALEWRRRQQKLA